MNIGIVSATYLPSRNGVATSTALFVRGLRALGHEVRLFVPQYPGIESETGVYRLPSTSLGAPGDYPILLPVTAWQARRLPLDDLNLVHAMHPFIAGRTALGWARRLGLPLVFTAHTRYHDYLHYAPTPQSLTRWAVRRHVRKFAAQADLVLVPGQAMMRVLRDYGYRREIGVVANPVDRERFGAVDASWVRPQLGVAERASLLIFVGRLAPEKNLEVLLRAFVRVAEDVPEARLLLIGDGPLRADLQAQFAGSSVLFTGAIDNLSLPPYLAAADLFVTASLSETGSPMALLEALAAGTPAVTARGTGDEDGVIVDGHNGLSCEPDEGVMHERIVSLLRDRPRLETLQEGALESAKAFDVKRQSRALEQCYRQLLGAAMPHS